MKPSKVRRQRHDPYKKFKFRVKWDGRYVAGLSKVSSLGDGSLPMVSSLALPAPHAFESRAIIVLERGITHDVAFARWADACFDNGKQSGVPLESLRKNLRIDLFDEVGKLADSFDVTAAWVSEFQALPDLDADANAVAIEQVKIEHEGCRRVTIGPRPLRDCQFL